MTSAHSTRKTSIRTRKIRGEDSLLSSISIAEREEGPVAMPVIIRCEGPLENLNMAQRGTGNSGWVDTIWTFSVGLVGAGSALWPIGDAAPNARQWLVAALVAIWSLRLGLHIAVRTVGITDD